MSEMIDTRLTAPESTTPLSAVGPKDSRVERITPGPAERNPRRYIVRRQRLERTLAWLVPIALVGVWQIAASSDWVDVRFFPSPWSIVQASRELIDKGLLQDAVWTSTKRVLIGFAFGVVSGIVAGLLLGVSRTVRSALEPTLMALYVVPKLAVLPLLLLVFGLGEQPKIILVAVSVFFLMWIQTMESIIATPNGYREALDSFGGSRWQMFRYVYLPAALPQIFVTMRLCTGVSILVMVGVEFVHGDDGIGFLIWNSWSLFLAKRMYVGIVAVSVMGLVFAGLVKVIGRRLLPWAPNDKTRSIS